MRVTFLTQYYPPEMGAPQARISEFARGLARRGWEVTVVTALPNYPSGRVFPEYQGRRFVKEYVDGTTVKRTWIRPDGSGRVAARLMAAFSFALSATLACLRSSRRGGVLVVESPPLTLGPFGLLIARLTGCAYVLNISDLWPRSLVEMGVLKGGPFLRAAEFAEALSYRGTALITAQSPDIVADIQQRFPQCAASLLSNGVDTHQFRPELRSEEFRHSLGVTDGLLVTYAGLHGLAQGLDAAVEAAYQLRSVPDLHFRFVGDGPAKASLVYRAEQLGLDNVRFLPPVPRDRIATLLASADIALVTLARPLRGAIPSKVYEAMASAVPVVLATGGGAAEFVSRSGAGLSVQPGNAYEIAKAVARLASDPALRTRCGEAGRRLVREQFDREIWIDRLDSFLRPLDARSNVLDAGLGTIGRLSKVQRRRGDT